MASSPSSPPPAALPSFPPCLSVNCGSPYLTPAVQVLIAMCCMFGGLAAFTMCYYLYSGTTRGAAEAPEQQQDHSASRTSAQIMRRVLPILTAVDQTSIGPGETCAICLGELCETVDRSRRDGDASPDAALAAEVCSGDPSRGTAGTAEARSCAPDAGTAAPSSRIWSALRVRVPGRRAAARSPTGAQDAMANGHGLLALKCGHCFHRQCIRAWIVHRGAAGDNCNCPLCKDLILVAESPSGDAVAAYV
jgi:hypothetical protein